MRVPERYLSLGLLALLALLALVPACDPKGAQRQEARRFLAAYDTLTAAEGLARQQEQLTALTALPLHNETVDAARDQCVTAHAALLESERAQEQAAKSLDAVLANAGGEPLPPQKTGEIREGIRRSEEALKKARASYGKCEDSVRGLALRFAER